jgi:hypothetical protein
MLNSSHQLLAYAEDFQYSGRKHDTIQKNTEAILDGSKDFIIFWVVAPCSHVKIYRRFRGTYCLIAMMMKSVRTSIIRAMRQYVPLKRRSTST